MDCPACCTELGVMWENGEGGHEDSRKAIDFFDLGCAGRDLAGCAHFGLAAWQHPELGIDPGRARLLLTTACDAKEGDACHHLSRFVLEGLGGEPDPAASRELVRTSCTLGSSLGCDALAFHLVRGIGGKPDLKEGMVLLRSACKRDLESACREIARLGPDSD